ncbi:hypothetical protein A0J61_09495 [Choanephora cucurbitarum]|uniref:Endonuclease/exonuclease/phosphatase domain-containing protein n=1 Tax=Choanephora cucurbitarum TaxID=101091 RepID=A0A1C7N539_9FUNG|nr:hypothetical protein A0J61_09495 [Choanephora cucurbitarum]
MTHYLTSPIMHILNIYAFATRQDHLAYFRALAANLPLMSILHSFIITVIVVGNFDYDTHKYNTIDLSWSDLLLGVFHDCFEQLRLPTLIDTTGRRSLPDYIFYSSYFPGDLVSMSHSFVSYEWTDHALLTTAFRLSCESMGKGLWKANLFLAKLAPFREGLTSHIQDYIMSENLLNPLSTNSAHKIRDALKVQAKIYTRSFQMDRLNWQRKSLKLPQAKFNRILREYKHTSILSKILPSIEVLIGKLQSEVAYIDQMKSGKHWREQGKNLAGFLKKTASTRIAQHMNLALQDPPN